MPLDEYRAKRDFTKSPEPQGQVEEGPRRGSRFFCVQKHLASHLHYDFRIEHEGVLLSWAVPKGPSLDPSVKRLAMHVEDHPIEYGTFEGVIPSGYGAGIVMLWDQGTWEPEGPDVGAALKKGDLKMRLHGVKLKGSWVLVRTRGAGGRGWLLIKHRDEWAGPIDIAEFAPLSVKSNSDFADILAQENPEVWLSNRPAQGGDTGAMFARIVERALAIKGEREAPASRRRAPREKAATSRPAPPRAAERTRAPARTSSRKTARPSGRTDTAMKRRATAARKPKKAG